MPNTFNGGMASITYNTIVNNLSAVVSCRFTDYRFSGRNSKGHRWRRRMYFHGLIPGYRWHGRHRWEVWRSKAVQRNRPPRSDGVWRKRRRNRHGSLAVDTAALIPNMRPRSDKAASSIAWSRSIMAGDTLEDGDKIHLKI